MTGTIHQQRDASEPTDKVYEARIDLTAENNSHTKAFRLIEQDFGPGSAQILDVGCSSGALGEAWRQHGHVVHGIEPSRAAAKVARQRLDRVFEGTLDEFLASEPARSLRYDYINFGDVLEHLVDPEAALRACAAVLKPNGAVVASLPNVAHVAVRAMLLEGRWDYDDFGLLDRTHLRFFTRRTLIKLFRDAGYAISRLDPIPLPVAQTGIDANPLLVSMIELSVEDDTLDVFQYVVLARRCGAASGEALAGEPARVRNGSFAESELVLRLQAQIEDHVKRFNEVQAHIREISPAFANALKILEARDAELADLRDHYRELDAHLREISPAYAEALKRLEMQAAELAWLRRVVPRPLAQLLRRLLHRPA